MWQKTIHFEGRPITDLLEDITPTKLKDPGRIRVAGEDYVEGPVAQRSTHSGGRERYQLCLGTTVLFWAGRLTPLPKAAKVVRLHPTHRLLDFVWSEMGSIPDHYYLELLHQVQGSLLLAAKYNRILGDRWLWQGWPRELPVAWRDTLGLRLPDAPSERAKLRPANFSVLPLRKQWEIDKQLELLDWDGT